MSDPNYQSKLDAKYQRAHQLYAQAYEDFQKATTYEEGTCKLDPLLNLTKPMSDPPAPEEWNLQPRP